MRLGNCTRWTLRILPHLTGAAAGTSAAFDDFKNPLAHADRFDRQLTKCAAALPDY
eukprot:gene10384-1780_t